MLANVAAADVVGVGQNALDTLIELPRFPAPDSEVEFLSACPFPGGQIVSAVIACRHWGLRTRYIGKVGDDAAGELHRAELARAGVEAHLIVVPNCASQSSFILVNRATGERTILFKRDKRLGLLPEDLRPDWMASVRLLHLGGHSAAAGVLAARWARAAGALVMADLDHIYPGIEELLPLLDYPVTSRSFALRWSGESSLPQALKRIAARYGHRIVCATLGRGGALAWDGARLWYAPAYQVEVVDSTGAGDIFHAAFAYGLLQGWPVDRLLSFSCAAAGLNCTALGARGGIKTLAEIESLRQCGPKLPAAIDEDQLSAPA